MKCNIEDCEKEILSKGFCSMHYYRFKRTGTTDIVEAPKKKCTAPNCTEDARTKGLCGKHYQKIRTTGTFETLRYGPEWLEKQRNSHTSQLGKLDPYKAASERGYNAVNVVNDIKYKAKQRGKDWQLTNEETYILITSSCGYCGFKPNWPETRVGIDRIDNSIGYVLFNCKPCCFRCNTAKGTGTTEEFYSWLQQAVNFLKTRGKIS